METFEREMSAAETPEAEEAARQNCASAVLCLYATACAAHLLITTPVRSGARAYAVRA